MKLLGKQTTNDTNSDIIKKRLVGCHDRHALLLPSLGQNKQNHTSAVQKLCNNSNSNNNNSENNNSINNKSKQRRHIFSSEKVRTTLDLPVSALTTATIQQMNVHRYEMTTLCSPKGGKSEHRYLQLIMRAKAVHTCENHKGESKEDETSRTTVCLTDHDDDVDHGADSLPSSPLSQPPSVVHVSKHSLNSTPQSRRNAVCSSHDVFSAETAAILLAVNALTSNMSGRSAPSTSRRNKTKSKSKNKDKIRNKGKQSHSQQANQRSNKDRRPHKCSIEQHQSSNTIDTMTSKDLEDYHGEEDSSSLTPFDKIRPLASTDHKTSPKASHLLTSDTDDLPKTTKKKESSSPSSLPKTRRRPKKPVTKSPLREELRQKRREKMLQQKAIMSCPNLMK